MVLPTLQQVGTIVLISVILYAWTLLLVRLSGLRSLATISTFDAVMTFAVGSALASIAIAAPDQYIPGLVFVGMLFLLQATVSLYRRHLLRTPFFENRPMMIMYEGKLLPESMRAVRMTPRDVLGKLRSANVKALDEVRAVVMETTGEISVVSAGPDERIDPRMLEGVQVLHEGERQEASNFVAWRQDEPLDDGASQTGTTATHGHEPGKDTDPTKAMGAPPGEQERITAQLPVWRRGADEKRSER